MKVLLVATVQSHIGQFHKPLIRVLKKHGVEVHVAARNNLAEKNGLALENVDQIFDIPFSRSPKSKDNIKSYKQLKKIINEGNYDIVHCNTPMGGITTRLAARKARKKGTKVFYTAHGFHFYEGAPKKNWLVFYPIEKYFAKHFTDKLITITKEDYNLANSKFKTDVCYIHGLGINYQKYCNVSKLSKEELRKKYGYDDCSCIFLCVGELNKNKNQSTVIKAMSKVVSKLPDSKLLIAGNGPLDQELKDLVKELGLEKNIDFLGYTLELDKYLAISDISVSFSYREGLPFNIMEAMLCERPVIASYNRGHRELIENDKTGIIVKSMDINEISEKMIMLAIDEQMKEKFTRNASEFVLNFIDSAVEKELEKIYGLGKE